MLVNGETCHHKIIRFLNDQREPVKKETISQAVHNSIETVAKALTELKNPNKYVVEFGGFWSITDAGRELPPNFDRSYYEPAKEKNGKTSSRVFWEQLIDWKYAHNDYYCRQVLAFPNDFQETWKPVKKYLTLFVLLYLAANDIELNVELPDTEVEMDDDFRLLIDALTDYINKKI